MIPGIPISSPYKLKIVLLDVPIEISRIVLVPDYITMQELHLVIQSALGWENNHLYLFTDKTERTRTLEVVHEKFADDLFEEDSGSINAQKASLRELFFEMRNKRQIYYCYDFGDHWWHKISFQKVTEKDLEIYRYAPICIEAKGACPPENIGGPAGFHDFYMSINNPESEEGQEFREYLGLGKRKKWDFEKVNMKKMNLEIMIGFLRFRI